jgi:uncharacterized protein (TIGR03435 family)
MKISDVCLLASVVISGHLASGQGPAGQSSFAVVSIRETPGCEARSIDPNPVPSPGHVRIECATVERLIRDAYIVYADGRNPTPSQIELTGGPDWIKSDRFDVEAKAEGPAPLPQMLGPMMQRLLEQRFGLRLHHESKELPVYVLSLAKGGAKLKPSDCTARDPDHPLALPAIVPGKPLPRICGNTRIRRGATSDTFDGDGLTTAEFLFFLGGQLGRKTIDRTGMSGRYDFHLEFLPEGDGGVGAAIAASIPQLGLKLSAERGTAEYIAVDSVEKPTGN